MEPPLTIKQHGLVRRALYVVDEEAAKVARRYGGLVPLDDLRTAGKLALYGCARRFVEGPGRTFEGYARFRVRGAMKDEVRCETREARVRREMARAGTNHMGDYHDDYDILRHDPAELERRLDAMCDEHATVMWLGGAMQARREAEQDPEAAAEYADTLAALDVVLGPIGEDDRTLLDLVFASGFKIEEAADALGVVRETAGRRLKRVLERLRRALAPLGVLAPPEPMSHPGVRPILVGRGPPREKRPPGGGDGDD
jgi:RNA polymerase sigma factor for flagellar operon FliA